MNSTFRKYTKKETDILTKEILNTKGIINNLKIAKKYSKEFNRNVLALDCKVRSLRKKLGVFNPANSKISRMKGRKRENKYTPFSDEEVKILIDLLKKRYRPIEIANNYSQKWNRSKNSITCKCYAIKNLLKAAKPVMTIKEVDIYEKDPAIVTVSKEVDRKKEDSKVGITLPEGMTFEGAPKKVVLYSDHFKVYF